MAPQLLPLAAAAAGSLATAAYLNAKYHISHDLSLARCAGDSKETIKHIESCVARKRVTTYHILQDQALIHRPDQLFLIYEDREITYKQFFLTVTRLGNWLLQLGVEKGDIVALDGGNSPEYLAFWFALEGIGASPSFVNNNLTGKSLVHCVTLCDARFLLVDRDVALNAQPCEEELKEAGIRTLYYDKEFVEGCRDDTPLPEERTADRTLDSLVGLLYTSGSTGLPKGVPMKQGRSLAVGYSIAKYLKLKPTDRFYTCMPLYHGAAHGLCTTPAINAGCTIVLGHKFSHSKFWPEVRKSKANIIQYVGELCRYLMNAPPSPLDKVHNVHMAWGNGMRPDVWESFRQRFGIPVINELYAATDGMGTTLNWNRGEFTKNAIGKRGIIWQMAKKNLEVRVKIDPDTEDILRDKKDFAIRCKTNEPGEVLHKIDPENPLAAWSGYWKNDTGERKRYLRNVFEKGDMWFRSGDMQRQDADGRVYFVDRLGDTFRWKSENVSTNEVSDVLGSHPQIAEANVYGVAVPNADGRCGCAAIVMADGVTAETFDFQGVARHVLDALPRYAVPYFLRITPQLDYTGTLKLQKGRLKRDGIDPNAVAASGDRLYWLPADGTAYVPYGEKDYEALKGGSVRL